MQTPLDPFAFLKAWPQMTDTGSSALPDFSKILLAPLDPSADSTETLDQRIANLKTIAQWLQLNLQLLQSAIQALEVQRGTLAALASYRNAVGGLQDTGTEQAQWWWNTVQAQFQQLSELAQAASRPSTTPGSAKVRPSAEAPRPGQGATQEATQGAVKRTARPSRTQASASARSKPSG